MKMEKEEKMTTADPKATKETVELWNYLHTVAGKQIITGQVLNVDGGMVM